LEFIRENPLQGEPVPRSGRQGVGKNESDPLSNKTEKQKVKTLFKIFPSPSELAEAFAEDISGRINSAGKSGLPFNLAVSGGNTPKLFFSILADKYHASVNWGSVHFFWVDERCVPPADPESNYGMTKQILLDKINIPVDNVHRMRGEDDPDREADRYAHEILMNVRKKDMLPVFDQVILGMGDDGHTASIFPGNLNLIDSEKICEVAVHPLSGQKRITLTGKVINNADFITFLATGQNKARIIEEIYKKKAQYMNYPASSIDPLRGGIAWFLDEKAGELIKESLIC
jgi:6-phosphogluconolactonase